MPNVKREFSPEPSSGTPSPPAKKGKKAEPSPSSSPSKGRPGAKTRIPREAKIFIAEQIIAKGTAAVDVEWLATETGLSTQQIKSQLVDNRQNVRKQLMETAKGLQ
ncbi:hypothetical protein P7C73_g3829, partial [Tremellales sp. Uapishka_1]